MASSMSWVTKRIVFGERLLEPEELVLESFPDDGVDGPERLVHEHDRRVGGEGPGDPDALPLASRELDRVAARVGHRVESDQGEQLLRSLATPRRGPAEEAGHGRHVLGDRLVGEEAHLLDDVPDPAAQLREVTRGGVRPVDEDPPEVGSMSRLTILSEVVLPQPEGPTSTQIFPAGTASERSLTAAAAPRCCSRRS